MVSRSKVARLLGSLAVGAALSLSSPAAHAEDAGKAAVLAQAADARARQGEARVAIDLYEEAYALTPRREYLVAIGRLYDALARAGDSRDVRLAILYYERSVEGDAQWPEREEVEASLARLRGWKARMRPEPQPPPPPALVPLHFLSYKPDAKYEVVSGRGRCNTPCTLAVAPGPGIVKATGSGTVELQIVVPPRASQIRLQSSDRGSVIAGAVMVPTGFVMAAGMWAIGLACGFDDGSCQIVNFTLWPVLGLSTLITGIVLLARGSSAPPPDANRIELVGLGRSVKLTSFGLGPVVGGGGVAGMGLSF